MLMRNDKISVRQLQALLILDIFGTGAAYLPRVAAGYARQDGWLSVILTSFFAVICAWVISSVAGRFPGAGFNEYCSKILSKPVGAAISFLLVVKIVIGCALELRLFGEIIKKTLLNFTPMWLVCGIMLLLGAYIAAKGYETRGRVAEILIFVVFVPLIFVFAVACFDIDFSNLLPVFETSPQNILQGGFAGGYAFAGLELLLIAIPYVNQKNKGFKSVRKNVVVAVMITGVLMTAITAITTARFGPRSTERQMWPVLEMMDTIDIPGSFIERQEAAIMSFWIISVFMIVNAGLFFASLLIKDTVKKGRHSWYILGLIPVILALANLPRNIDETLDYINKLYQIFGTAFLLIVPLVLLITAKIRRLGRHA